MKPKPSCKRCKDKGIYMQGKRLRVQMFCDCPAGDRAVKEAHAAEYKRPIDTDSNCFFCGTHGCRNECLDSKGDLK